MDIDYPEMSSFRREWRTELGRGLKERSQRNMNSNLPFNRERSATVASTVTEGRQVVSTIRESSVDVEMSNTGDESDKRFIVAIDFGTTFSSVSFLALPRDTRTDDGLNVHMYMDEIQSIINFPDEPRFGLSARRKEVPTEIWYPKKSYLDQTLLKTNNRLRNMNMANRFNDTQALAPGLVLNEDAEMDTDEDADMDTDEDADDEDNKDTFWGYEVQNQLKFPDTNRNQNRRMSRFKLLLDESELTRYVRGDLQPNLAELRRKKLIKNNEDVIADYLKHLFTHTKNELIQEHEFTDACPIEFVLCVPPIWTPKASRIMQDNMERAIRESGFGTSSVKHNSVDDLFIVSEPEAAAAYVLAKTTAVQPKESFVLIDAGGGTVDAITYTVDKTYPLRLKAESVEAGGDLCGSSYLNEEFQKHLRSRLEGENYLEINGLTIESIIDCQVIAFENEMKRSIDVTTPNIPPEVMYIQGLRANSHPEKRFLKNRLKVEHADLKGIFIPFLERVAVLMRTQLRGAQEKGINVKKVILIGGFAESPSLRSYLAKELAIIKNSKGEKIIMIVPKAAETAVSSGAVLRALDKSEGPDRISRSSYGFLCSEEYQPNKHPAHKKGRPSNDPLDGRRYLNDTIFWLINKGDKIPPFKEYSVQVFYIFDAEKDTRFECEEVLFVSDSKMKSHYRKTHEKNKGASIVGVIETDMTFLKERNLIQPVEPEEGVKARRHYKVDYELVMIVNGRNLRWEARYPAGGEVQGGGQISIAAAFVPGTK